MKSRKVTHSQTKKSDNNGLKNGRTEEEKVIKHQAEQTYEDNPTTTITLLLNRAVPVAVHGDAITCNKRETFHNFFLFLMCGNQNHTKRNTFNFYPDEITFTITQPKKTLLFLYEF